MISVVVATWNRAGLLEHALRSLLHQSLEPDNYEIVVVDDGSDDDTSRVADRFQSGPQQLRYYRQRHSGLAVSRNKGMDLSRYEVVLFFDDDDIAHKDLLREHVETHATYPQSHIAVLGFTDWAPDLHITPLMRYLTEVGQTLFSYGLIAHGELLHWDHFWGGRTSVKRSFLDKFGRFNPIFKFGCEDVELGYRLQPHGLSIFYNANARSWMKRPLDLGAACLRHELIGRSSWVFHQLHPEEPVRNWVKPDHCEEHWNRCRPLFQTRYSAAQEIEDSLGGSQPSKRDDLQRQLYTYYAWLFRAASCKGLTEARASSKLEGNRLPRH